MRESHQSPESFDWRADVRARLSTSGLRSEDEADIVEEVAQHLEQQFTELTPQIGATAARERLLRQLRDEAFEGAVIGRRRRVVQSRARVWSSTSVLRDFREGFRSLRRSPATLIAGSAALSLGIGLTVAMFSIIYGLLLKGLPYDNPSRIAVVKLIDPREPGVDALIPFGDLAAYRAQQRSFETLGAYSTSTVNVSGGDRADRVQAAEVTVGTIEVTRTAPALGRSFQAADADPSAPPAAILSHSLWRDRFASNPNVVGATIRVDGRPRTIVGVMPDAFEFPYSTRIWLPLQANATVPPGEGPMVNPVGRLRPDASYENANAEFASLAGRLAAVRPVQDARMRIVVLPFVRASVNPRFYWLMNTMFVAVFLVLLVACANVANLLLDRAANRSREIGIRTALGASRLAIVRQSLVESSILAIGAAIVGIAIAQVGITVFNRAVANAESPLFWMDVGLHPAVLLFVVATAVVASIVSGLAPAIQSARIDISAVLKDESHGASSLRVGRLSRTLVVVQIAVSSAILLASGFITRSIVNLRDVDPGFTTAGLVTARVTLTTGDTVRQRAFFERLDRELATLPGNGGVYLGNGLPGAGWVSHHAYVEGRTYRTQRERPIVSSLAVTPGFFTTFGVRATRGRTITAADRSGAADVAVVSESFVRRQFHGEDAIGKRIRVSSDSTAPWLTIIGVIPTLFAASIDNPWPPEVLTSFWQEGGHATGVVALRGTGDATSAALRRIVASIDPETPVYKVQSMADVMKQPMWLFNVFATIFLIFGAVALVLSSIGLYAVMAFSVSRRIRELGIRLALGATAGDVLGMVFRQGARQTAVGMAIGLVVGLVLVRAASAALFGVRPGDPLVMAVVAIVLGGTATIACIVPARRATRVDPLIALRTD
ncbi:MAG TPA: ABC transporter permease [Gemmatimonadaceae bacterium]|nr:ABC transporter permease [Gemmatimonadaceae bacterium]